MTTAKKPPRKGWIQMSIDQLVKADWNYKERDEVLTAKLKENIKRNGFVQNLLVRRLDTGFYEVVNGNHRLDVALELGVAKVMVFNFGEISIPQAQRIAVETNETNFPTDSVKLGSVLKEIMTEFDVMDIATTMPFSKADIVDLADLSNWTPPNPPEPPEPDNTETLTLALTKPTQKLWERWLGKVREHKADRQATNIRAFELAIEAALNAKETP